MRIVLGVLVLGHAVAHLPGFLVNLQLRSFPELPFKTTVLGGSIEVGEGGIRAIGLAWLTLAIAFGFVAIATVMRVPWWQPFAYVTIGLSIVLCLIGWPDARVGMLANVLILGAMFFGARANWF